jgi:hypothetical protein
MATGFIPDVGVPAGSPLVAGPVSYAPTIAPATGCEPILYHKAGCKPVDDRVAWNLFIANWMRAMDVAGLAYKCTSPEMLHEMICAIAKQCTPVVTCRSTVATTTVWPPVAFLTPFVIDDIAATPILYFWDCNSQIYVAIGTGFDLCADVPVAATDTAQPVYGLQCINGAPTRVPLAVASSAGLNLHAKERWTSTFDGSFSIGFASPIDFGNQPVPQAIEPGYQNPWFGLPVRIASVTTNALSLVVTFLNPLPNANYHVRFIDGAAFFPTNGVTSIVKTVSGFTINTTNDYRGTGSLVIELEAYA